MSHSLLPRGPEDSSVYWRRRALVVLSILFVLVVAWRAIMANDAPPMPTANVPVVTASPTTTPSSDPSMSTSPEPSGTANATDMPSTAPVVAGTCADTDVKVSVDISAKATAAGTGLHMTMHVVNVSGVACKRDVGAGPNEILITSGSTLIWSTDHCYPSQASHVITLKAKQDWSVSTTWDGHRSAQGCQDRGIASAGSYVAHGRNGTAKSVPIRFVVK